ncbi:MAG TPA: hypothetical protein V6D22_06295 [Candidatus Obscuribacterales bacterium]
MKQTEAHEALMGLSADEFLEVLEKATPEQLQAIGALSKQTRVNTKLLPRWFANALAAPAHHSSVFSILLWWEQRRLHYNLIVGLCGLPTLAVMGLVFHMPLALIAGGTIAYGVAANICYSIGSPAEMVAWLLWKDKASHLGPVFLSLGTIFSLCLTLSAAFLSLAAWVACAMGPLL